MTGHEFTGCRPIAVTLLVVWSLVALVTLKACQPPRRELVSCEVERVTAVFEVEIDELQDAGPRELVKARIGDRLFMFRAERFENCEALTP